MWRVADGVLIHEVAIEQTYGEYWQELNNLEISQDGVFVVGAAKGRMVSVWMDFLTFMEFEEGLREKKAV